MIFPRLGQIYSMRKKVSVNPVDQTVFQPSCWTWEFKLLSQLFQLFWSDKANFSLHLCFPLYLPLSVVSHSFIGSCTGSGPLEGVGGSGRPPARGGGAALVTVALGAQDHGSFVRMFGPRSPSFEMNALMKGEKRRQARAPKLTVLYGSVHI